MYELSLSRMEAARERERQLKKKRERGSWSRRRKGKSGKPHKLNGNASCLCPYGLTPLLLFTAETNKAWNELKAQRRMMGLPAHRPWCHEPRLDRTIWHTAWCPCNPPSMHFSSQVKQNVIYYIVCNTAVLQPGLLCFVGTWHCMC